MRCTRVEKFLPLYVAGDLAGHRAERRVANHLATCERCSDAATEYDASRDLVRAATLPPDFDAAFYEEIRRTVLAEITRGRTRLAPPASHGFASLFNARFAYAASLALVVAALAALSLQGYIGRKSEEALRPHVIANVNRESDGTAAATSTPVSNQARDGVRQSSSPVRMTAREANQRRAQAAKSSSMQRRADGGDAQNERPRSVNLAKHAPVTGLLYQDPARKSLSPRVGVAWDLSGSDTTSLRRHSPATDDAPEVSRIEIQTADPNIRIIWLSPKPDDAVAQPLK
jgi:hypothetical protein